VSCPICGSEYCDGEKCSENGGRDPYGPDFDNEDDDYDAEEEEEDD
jgi:hypothetical protein